MTITNVNIHNIFTEGKLKAIASIVIDNFIEVHDIKVVQGTDRLFVGMPSRKTADGGFADMVHPIFAGAREVIEVPVLDAYAAYVAQMT
ncbi:MAG: SpoVG family protein, partial [Ruminococcus sp.]|nr:SpoVG family protein [Ruminococcus sp.]